MWLTDDYFIVSDQQAQTQAFVEKLIRCSINNGFQFNKKKLKSNFELNDNFNKEPEPDIFKWIGKTFYLPSFQVEHVQSLDKKEAFYAVNTNLTCLDASVPDFLKSKFKTFFMNQNMFYFNKKINCDEKILELIPWIVRSAYFKLNTFFPLVERWITKQNYSLFALWIARKLIESIVDCSYLVSINSTYL